MLGEYDNGSANGTGRTEYIWLPTDDANTGGGAIPVGMYRNGKFFAIHTDHLGTPRLMTDSPNKPVWQWPYSAFGNNKPTGILKPTTSASGAFTNQPNLLATSAPAAILDLRFPGQMADEETGLFYNYFRTYQPAQGRYTQNDPIGMEGGLNRYAYANGAPTMYTDPLGLWSATVGAYAGVGGQITFGNDGGNGFMTARGGFGIGGGVTYNPTGRLPGPAPQNPSVGGIALSCSAKANFNAGSLSASLEKGVARNYSNAESAIYGGASASGRDRFTGLGASGSVGGQITIYSGKK